jgi:hypothetical protein
MQRLHPWFLGSVVLIGLFLAGRAAAEPQPPKVGAAWEPAKTWVFAISSTEWKYDRALNMPKKSRHDLDLIDTFKTRGVPADHITFLKDKEGTIAHIRQSFKQLLSKTQNGDFLIFYFQGHGSRDINGNKSSYYFVNYDAKDDDDKSFLYMHDVYDIIEAHFKGSQVLLTADCCCSGGLVVEARKRKTPLAYACLTSVFAHNGSTGAWTYTQGLIKGFRGEAVMDLDGDGVVTLDELRRSIDAEMAFVEEQKSAYQVFNGFDPGLQIATAEKKSNPDVGKYIEAKQDDKWYRAQIVDFKDSKYKVLYLGYDEREWVTTNRIRDIHPKQFREDTKVSVKDEEGKWHNATVKKALYGLHFVHFDDDKSPNGVMDEWVSPDCIKLRP